MLRSVVKLFAFDAKVSYLRTISYNRELNQIGQGRLRSRPLRFNRAKIFLDVSFIQDQWVGFVAKKQGFPKLCPTLTNPRACTRYGAYKELVKMWAHICARSLIPVKMASGNLLRKAWEDMHQWFSMYSGIQEWRLIRPRKG